MNLKEEIQQTLALAENPSNTEAVIIDQLAHLFKRWALEIINFNCADIMLLTDVDAIEKRAKESGKQLKKAKKELIDLFQRWALECVGEDINWTDEEALKFSTDLAHARFYEMATNMEKKSSRQRIEESTILDTRGGE